MSLKFLSSMLGLMLGIAVAFAAARAHELGAPQVAPVSTLLSTYVDSVGPDGDIELVASLANGGVVRIHGHSPDPARVLANLSASPLVHDARLEPQDGAATTGLQTFVLTAKLPRTNPELRAPGVPTAQAREQLQQRVQQVLDAALPGKCQLISADDRTQEVDVTRSLTLMLRLRCGGSLDQLAAGLREIELGKPAIALSRLVIYPRGAMEPPAPASQVDLRITATGLLQ